MWSLDLYNFLHISDEALSLNTRECKPLFHSSRKGAMDIQLLADMVRYCEDVWAGHGLLSRLVYKGSGVCTNTTHPE